MDVFRASVWGKSSLFTEDDARFIDSGLIQSLFGMGIGFGYFFLSGPDRLLHADANLIGLFLLGLSASGFGLGVLVIGFGFLFEGIYRLVKTSQ